MTDFDVVIVGAGVVGLACGRTLSNQGLKVVVLEREKMLASITSARNSEVVHTGFYYPQNSLKHLLCLRGRHLLLQFAIEADIGHKKCGKLVLATDAQEQNKIEELYQRAQENGVENVHLLTAAQAKLLEPQIQCAGGLFSAETAIMDTHGFCQALAHNIEEAGGIVALNTPFVRAEPRLHGFDIDISGCEAAKLRSRFLINSAGLGAAHVARRIDGRPNRFLLKLFYAKGSYFSLSGKSPFSHLVYPAPVEGGLGVHATLDLAGRVRFGPDVEWLNDIDDDNPKFDYRVDASRSVEFYAAIRRYWPQLPDGALSPDYAGIRPKLSDRGQNSADFLIEDGRTHGVAGLVNLFGMESPGLTASLAIGEEVAKRISQQQ